jgi:hypothetical protein
MRARSEPPAATRVFRAVGADPTLAVFEVTNATGLDGLPTDG